MATYALMNISYEDINKRAFEIWQREGQPEGRDLEHWLQAEKELQGEYQQNRGGKPEKATRRSSRRA